MSTDEINQITTRLQPSPGLGLHETSAGASFSKLFLIAWTMMVSHILIQQRKSEPLSCHNYVDTKDPYSRSDKKEIKEGGRLGPFYFRKASRKKVVGLEHWVLLSKSLL